MKKHILLLLTLSATLVLMVQSSLYIKAGASSEKPRDRSGEKLARLSERASVRAAGRGTPWINLRDGRDLVSEHAGAASLESLAGELEPLAVVSGDFDGDGTPDLITAHRAGQGGMLTFYRGNVDAVYPNSAGAKERKAAGRFTDAPFLAPGQMLGVEVTPDFLGAGDFDADGHRDVAAAARGGSSLHIFSGNGRGSFIKSRRIDLPGRVTAMTTGEINRVDGLEDIVVGITGPAGASAMVFQSMSGAVEAVPESYALPSEAADFALGNFIDAYEMDLAVAAGKEIVVIEGLDRHALSNSNKAAGKKSAARTMRRRFASQVRSIVTGSFTGGYRFEIGVLSADGEALAITPGKIKAKPDGMQTKPFDQWKAEKLSKDRWPLATRLGRAKVSSLPVDNMLVIDPPAGQVHIVTGSAAAREVRLESISMDVEGEPVASISMRLNSDALTDLVILRKGQIAPTFVMTAPVGTITVTNTNDSGAGSLRQAIEDANNSGGTDEIVFMIGSGEQTISLSSQLPDIIDPVTLDATTQPGFAGTPLILVDGNKLPVTGFVIDTSSCVVRGFAIDFGGGDGISIGLGGSFRPLGVQGGNIIEANYIGLDQSGQDGFGMGGSGVKSTLAGNTIGSLTPGFGNVIARTGASGIQLGDGDMAFGNRIGTNAAGTASLGGFDNGIVATLSGAVIGGSQTGAGNLVSGQMLNGIDTSSGVIGIIVRGNLIGTDITGTSNLGNQGDGIVLNNASDCTIGGALPGQGNIISGNGGRGIFIQGKGASSNVVQGNFIGVQADGSTGLGNGSHGVLVASASSVNTIGGTDLEQGNVIGFNGGAGVAIADGFGNAVRGNSIFSNEGIGIDLNADGVTPNDADDSDSGPNNLQNFPVLTSASVSGGNITVQGSLMSGSVIQYTIDFYASSACDGSGNGEGGRYIGSTLVTTNNGGLAGIDTTFSASVAAGEVITATASEINNTSEFSACVTVVSGDQCVTFDNDSGDGLWQNPENWSTDLLPGSGDDACIPSQFTVTLSSGLQTINSLTNDGTLIISGGSLITNGPSTSNSLTVNSGSQLSILNSFIITGELNLADGSVAGANTLTINKGAVLNIMSNATFAGLTVDNLGTANWTGIGDIAIGDDATFNNLSGATFNAQVSGGTISGGGLMFPGAFNNAGTFRKSGTTGLIFFGSELFFSNTGAVDIQTGNVVFFNGGMSSGNLNVESDTIISFEGGTFTIEPGATMTGSGVFSVLSTVIINGSLTIPNIDVIAIFPPKRSTGRQGLDPSGFIAGTLSGKGNVTITSVSNFTGGTMSGSGATIINTGATMNISGDFPKEISQRTVSNAGTVIWTGGGGIQLNNGAVFNNTATGLFHVQTGGVEFASTGGGTFNNAGEFRKSTSVDLVNFTGGIPFNNSGLVSIQAGTLSFGGGYTQTAGNLALVRGNVSVDGTLVIQGGSITGAGMIDGNVSNGGQLSPGGSPGIINIAGDYTQTPAGVLNLEIGGLTAGSEYDVVNISGAATLDGTLNIILINSFVPNVGDSFQVLTFASRNGSFATVNGLVIDPNRSFELNFGTNDLSLGVVSGASADLSIAKSDAPDPVAAGSDITYTIEITNSGPDGATTVQLSDAVPANTTFQSLVAPLGWSCMTPSQGGTGSITCTKSIVNALAVESFTLVVRVNPGTPDETFILNTASVTSDADPNNDNDTAATTTLVSTPACALICPENVTVNSSEQQCGAVVSYTVPTGGNECGTVTCSPPPGAFFPVGTTTVNCAPNDGTGCSFTVTVVDNVPPRITCPGNIVTSTTTGSAVVDYVLATATDNCSTVSPICLPPSGTVFPLGTNTVNCSATDASGNTATCSFTITVNDGRSPTINCPPDVTADATPGQCTATVNYPPPVVTDSTSETTISCVPPSGSAFPLGTTTVFCTATNQAGNTVRCSFNVTVNAPPAVRVTIAGGGTSLQPGPVDPPLRPRNNPPAECNCVSTFTIENTGCAPFTLTLSEIARIGADVDSGRITNSNDTGFFSVRLVNADQTETRLDTGAQVSFNQGQSRSFRLVFNPVLPAFTGRTTGLAASDVLPDPTTSRIVFNQGGSQPLNVAIPINARVSTAVRLLNPDNSRDAKRVIFTKSGNEFTVSLAVFDSNLDVNRIRYEFLDGQGRVVDQAFDIDMTGPIQQANIVRGQSFKVSQRFTGANSRPQITSVRVTVFDPSTSDSFTAQLQIGTTTGVTLQSLSGEGAILLRPLTLGRD